MSKDTLAGMAKALVGALAAFVASVALLAKDGVISPGEWWEAAAAGAAVLSSVYYTPNKGAAAAGKHEAP